MFRLLKVVFLLVVGAYIGFQISLYAMRSECAAQTGVWTGSVCNVTGAGE
ncbi:MAG: hypothetical protein AB8B60_07345 [Sulfitobacter sp.]